MRRPRRFLRLRDVLEERDIVRRAYLTGYLLGYAGHLAWSGWSRELKEAVFRSAEERGLLRKAIIAFRKGRIEGASDRELDIMLGIYQPPVTETELSSETIRAYLSRSSLFGMLSSRPTGAVRFLRFVRFSNSRHHLRVPDFLRRP
ncbi:hypothetical protein [Thermococcus sp.]